MPGENPVEGGVIRIECEELGGGGRKLYYDVKSTQYRHNHVEFITLISLTNVL